MKTKWSTNNVIHFSKSHFSHEKTRKTIEKRMLTFINNGNAGDFLALTGIAERIGEQGKEHEYIALLFLMLQLIELKNGTISENNRKRLADELLAQSKNAGVYNEEGHFFYVCHVMLRNKTGFEETLKIAEEDLCLTS